MKVLLANKFFYDKGGAETVFFQERSFLLSSGIQVVDFSMKDDRNAPSPYASYFVKNRSYRDPSIGGLEKLKSGLAFIHSFESVRNISKLIRQEKPDILHCHNIYHQITPSIMWAAKKFGIKIILTLHDYKSICPFYARLCHGKPCDACITGDFFNVVRRRCADGSMARSALMYAEATFQQWLGSYECVDRVIAVSKFMADSVTRWRFPKDRVSLLYNGVNPGDYPQADPCGEKPYLLFLGRLSPEKGLMTLGKVQAKTNIRVVVAGTGPLEETLRKQFSGLELVGHKSGEALKALVANAAATVLPAEWYENCPMSVLESMAAGKAVIGSRMGGIPELVEHGKTGLLYESGNAEELAQAMRYVLANPDDAAEMGKRGRERVLKNFSLQEHNKGLLDIYESVLS